ncbi:MAG: VWA domain-containing protein, partial [Cutibacterium granulosum]|nr:VWA domain-containing protein [Cutibacterium granulosum]
VAVASTTDTGTIVSAANSLTWREDTKGTGTDIGVGVPAAVEALQKARESAPQATRMVFYLGDGEQTATRAPGSFAALKPLVTSGTIYAYGTAKGAPMARSAFDSSDVTYHGRKAISHADHATLTTAARQAGLSFAARSPGRTLTPPQVSLNRTSHEEQMSAGTDLAWILGLVAAADVAAQLTMSARRLRRARKDVP